MSRKPSGLKGGRAGIRKSGPEHELLSIDQRLKGRDKPDDLGVRRPGRGAAPRKRAILDLPRRGVVGTSLGISDAGMAETRHWQFGSRAVLTVFGQYVI